MKIAVLMQHSLHDGGGFQQDLNVLTLLNEHQSDERCFVFITGIRSNIPRLAAYGITAQFLNLTMADKLLLRLFRYPAACAFLRNAGISNPFDRFLSKLGIDLIYFISSSNYALYTDRYNYIFSVLDLCHRDFMEFPEVRECKRFEIREELYACAVRKAIAVIAESPLGRENIIRRYGVDPERVEVLSISPAPGTRPDEKAYQVNFVDIKKKYTIEGEYIFYPAQFWAHKNHVYILKALASLRKKTGVSLYAVFSGADKGNRAYVVKAAERLGVADLVRCVGFVPDEMVPYLYRQSIALVMPTYFGPVNMPPLEAFQLGVPVVYSDLPGLREQVGDAALLVDLADPGSLVKQLMALRDTPGLREDLIKKGRQQLLGCTAHDGWKVLESVFARFSIKLSCWSTGSDQ